MLSQRFARTISSSIRPSTISTSHRQFSTSRVTRADSSHGAAQSNEHYPQEGFSSPAWRNTILILIAGFGFYRLSDIYSQKPSSDGEDEDSRPFLTRYIEHYTTPSSTYKERNLKHLELRKDAAEYKLFAQDAERPPVHRLRYASTFEQASPHCIAPGSQVDLSDLKVKKEDE